MVPALRVQFQDLNITEELTGILLEFCSDFCPQLGVRYDSNVTISQCFHVPQLSQRSRSLHRLPGRLAPQEDKQTTLRSAAVKLVVWFRGDDTTYETVTLVLQHTLTVRWGDNDTTCGADTADKGGTKLI